MAQLTSQDVKEIKTAIGDLLTSITGLRDEMRSEFTTVNTRASDLREEVRVGFADVKGKIDTVNSRLSNLESNSQKIPDLAEKVGELKNWKQIAIVFFTATVGGAIGWFARGGKL